MPIFPSGHTVTAAEFNAMLPVGAVVPFAGTAAPTGWLLCDGSAVSRTAYADLFSVIGTTFGTGDGSTTFNVPDTQGYTVVHQSPGDSDFGSVGDTGGAKTHTLTEAELANHQHTGQTGTESANHTHSGTTASGGPGGSTINNPGVSAGSGATESTFNGTNSAAHTHAFTTGGISANHTHAFTTNATGGGTAHNNLQPFIVLLGIIRY